MATESPVRMVESTNWPSSKAVTAFSSQLHNIAGDELEVLLKTHKYRDQTNMAPNRSGSAPPSIEGSFAAYGNLMAHKSSNLKSSSMSFGNSLKTSESEEQMRADPAYVDYYYSNVNLNPRLPPPIVSRENNGNNWRLTSYDDSGNGSLHFARDSLSPHKEENEEDKSDNCSDCGNVLTPGYDAHHKSVVDLIQEDFPRTPSPLYNLSHSSSHAATSDELSDNNVQSISLDNLFLSASKLSNPNLGSVNACADLKTEDSKPYNPTSNEGPLDTSSLLDGSNVDTTADAPRPPEDVRNMYTRPGDKLVMLNDATKPDIRISQQQISNENRQLLQQHTPFSQPQHLLPSSGVTPLYTTTKAYMTSGNLPFYPGGSHLSSGSLYAAALPPQYGGYTLNPAFLPQYVAGYPTAGIHMQYSAAATTPGAQYFNGRAGTSFSSGEVIPHTGVDLLHQQLNKFYGGQQQQGLTPLQMQYFQQHAVSQGAYGGQYGYFTSTNAFDGQDNYGSFSSEKQAAIDAAIYRGVNGRGAETTGSGSGGGYGSPSMAQFQVSPFGSPFLPGSPVAPGVNTLGRRNELRLSPGGSNRNVEIYNQWQGQKGAEIVSDPQKKHSILDELKSFGARKFDLSDIAGRIVEFSVDQHGSRFIQQKLEYCGDEERESVFREILPHASKLMTDVFGNYVIQKFFEHGSCEQRKQLADILRGQILPLTFQMYGCRVIQKALEVIELDQKTELVHELDGHVLRCVRDQNGNHVIQKCIESIPTEKIGFILSSFQGEVATLSTHPYGCRVIQRVLEHCGDNLLSQCIIDEILESAHILAQDQYGNYVAQHVLERGKPHERSKIISKLTGRIVQMSQHKYASNVVEKCLEYGDVAERERLIEEILGISDEDNNLLTMMKDQFANYVVQKTLEISSDKQREVLLSRINLNLQALKKYTYGKHIVARFEQLCGEEAEG